MLYVQNSEPSAGKIYIDVKVTSCVQGCSVENGVFQTV